jgi:ABC-type multidrug transport system fused ATPase/permease subunit
MNKLFKILWLNLTSKDKKQFLFVTILTIISSLLEVFSIGMVIPLITVFIEPSKLMDFTVIQEVAHYFNIYQPQQFVFPVVTIFIFVTIISAIIRIFSIKVSADFAFSIGSELSIKAYENILYRSYSEHKSINSSEDISKLVSKINAVIQSLIFPSIMLLSALIMFFVISTIFLFINLQLTISLVVGLLFIYSFVTIYFKTRLKVNSLEIASMQDKQVQIVQESFGGIKDVIINNSFKYFINIYTKIDKNLRQRQSSNIVVSQSPRYLIESISIVFLIVLSYYFTFVNQIIPKDMILPTFITVAMALQRILPIAQQAYRSWANIEGNKQSLIDVLELLKPRKVNITNINNSNLSFKNEITLSNISFKYDNSQKLILKDINLTIKKGEKIGFIGDTGSGKSTLIDIIMGLLKPTNGYITIDDIKLNNHNLASWYHQISHVPQNIYILDSDFYQNIAFGSESENIDKLKVEESGKLACADEFIKQKNNNYSDNVGERGSKLSGGQKQRLGIARFLQIILG